MAAPECFQGGLLCCGYPRMSKNVLTRLECDILRAVNNTKGDEYDKSRR